VPANRPDPATARRALDGLRALAPQPAAQAEWAASLLEPGQAHDVLSAALDVLARTPHDTARPHLLETYDWLDRDRRRDPGGFLRAAALHALKPFAVPADAPLFERACLTIEPTVQDACAPTGLRAAGLVALSRADERLAAFHAARLLVDVPGTSAFSGEPALTAVAVLAALGHDEALYGAALMGLSGVLSADVSGACLAQLGSLPASLLRTLGEDALNSGRPAILLGLADLLISAEAREAAAPLARGLLSEGEVEVAAYFAAAIVASRQQDLMGLLRDVTALHATGERRTALEEALRLAPGREEHGEP
jgi:hypothetical protein